MTFISHTTYAPFGAAVAATAAAAADTAVLETAAAKFPSYSKNAYFIEARGETNILYNLAGL